MWGAEAQGAQEVLLWGMCAYAYPSGRTWSLPECPGRSGALTEVGELHSLTDWQVSEASEDAELEDFCKRRRAGRRTGQGGRRGGREHIRSRRQHVGALTQPLMASPPAPRPAAPAPAQKAAPERTPGADLPHRSPRTTLLRINRVTNCCWPARGDQGKSDAKDGSGVLP